MPRFSTLLILAIALALPGAALAALDTQPSLSDHRVRTAIWQPDQVFKFTGHYGFQSVIELSPDETIQTISMGDSTAWMLQPIGNRLFLKPIEPGATTNMTLITDKRTYLFELHAREAQDINDPDMTFILRFLHSGDDLAVVKNYLDSVPIPDVDQEPGKYNFNYTISGSTTIAPIRIFDDGEFTYFEFRGKSSDVPAFFTVDSQGNEALVNYRTRGNYIVVERVAARFTLRHGPDIVCVFNEKSPQQLKATPQPKT
ncbi:MAG: P-type conjugative transfer protein VirB9 [Alphaproteobacteria bacterium]|nr:P-type conjugative transfer protein VirB9 [Alphaproteobacteria bacterium]